MPRFQGCLLTKKEMGQIRDKLKKGGVGKENGKTILGEMTDDPNVLFRAIMLAGAAPSLMRAKGWCQNIHCKALERGNENMVNLFRKRPVQWIVRVVVSGPICS